MSDTPKTYTPPGTDDVWSWDEEGYAVLADGEVAEEHHFSYGVARLLASVFPRPPKPIEVGDVVHSKSWLGEWSATMVVVAIAKEHASCIDADGDLTEPFPFADLAHGVRLT